MQHVKTPEKQSISTVYSEITDERLDSKEFWLEAYQNLKSRLDPKRPIHKQLGEVDEAFLLAEGRDLIYNMNKGVAGARAARSVVVAIEKYIGMNIAMTPTTESVFGRQKTSF